MKNEILEIAKRLESDEITFQSARQQLCALFGIVYEPKVSGLARVKKDTKWVYKGMELPIIGIYATYQNGAGFDVYPNGTRKYTLSLDGTEWADRKYTVIHEKHLEILELSEV